MSVHDIGKKRNQVGGNSRMSNFEKRFGKYAIRNLPLILIICYVVGYLIELINPQLQYYMTLNPYAILHGQVWRLVTWILIPPSSFSLFTVIMLFFYYSIGVSLERVWGTYQYNVYMISGMLFTIAGSFAALGVYYLMGYGGVADEYNMQVMSMVFSTYYINMSIFMAYAATFPNAVVLLMFIIPVKMKWMGIAYSALLLFDVISATGNPMVNIFYRTAIVASLLNFIVFWLRTRMRHMAPKQVIRRQQFKSQVHQTNKITKHKCAICGRTDEDDPSLEFRFCSKCNGNYEYCQYHLFTHEHVK